MEHRVTLCTACRHTGTDCRPGYDLIERLRQAIASAGDAVSDGFAISGTACLTGCDRPCTVAYHGTHTATYLFGDVDADADINALVVFAQHCARDHDRLRATADSTKPLAEIPAAIVAIEATELRAS